MCRCDECTGGEFEEDRPEFDDAYIGDHREGYTASIGGQHLGVFPRWTRAAAALYLECNRLQWWPNVWSINDRGNVEQHAFNGHQLTATGLGYV